jgi:hypothetical protein
MPLLVEQPGMQFAGAQSRYANFRCCFRRSGETTVKRADAMDKLMDRKVFNARDAR